MTCTNDNETTAFQKLWPTYAEFASDAGRSEVTVQVWRHRNGIPKDLHARIARAGAERGIGRGPKVADRLLYLLDQLEALGGEVTA